MLSLGDVAATNILNRLVENFGFRQESEKTYVKHDVRVLCVEGSMLTADEAVAKIESDLVLVPSKHVSESGRPCILAHSTGNWGSSAIYGGKPSMLSMTSASAMYRVFHAAVEAVESIGLKNVEVGYEATHHGPFSDKPLIFVEVGSSLESWQDIRMAEAAAQAIHNVCFDRSMDCPEAAVGFGGGHYARDILRAVIDERFAVGHIASKHHFPLSMEMTFQAFLRTVEKPKTALIDWDGIRSDHRAGLLKNLEELGVDIVKV